MAETVIRIDKISKLYRLGQVGTGSLAHDVNRWWHQLLGKEDPYLKVGETNDRTQKADSNYVWALKDISFSIEKGDVVGIIGRNGAGKSTLLKVLSRTTAPTTGSVKVKGRIASLLEVGTGFHPELTGRENIFLNGAILGMTRKEIQRKFDEIVDFAGVERYIDTPVKRYSSGMYVRLAFAVAAHLEPEILIVDEVLAVGDAEFQKKCLGKMKDVSEREGRTVLFVSHNIASVKTLCNKGIVMRNGEVYHLGDIDSAIISYQNSLKLSDSSARISYYKAVPDNQKPVQIQSIRILDTSGAECEEFDVWNPVVLEFEYVIREQGLTLTTPIINVEKDGTELFWSFASDLDAQVLEPTRVGQYRYRVQLPSPLKKGFYTVSAKLGKLRMGDLDAVPNAVQFMVDEFSFDPTNLSYASARGGIVPAVLKWELISHEPEL